MPARVPNRWTRSCRGLVVLGVLGVRTVGDPVGSLATEPVDGTPAAPGTSAPALAAPSSPAERGPRVHDPSTIVRCGDEYWVFATGNGVLSFRSKDLVTWVPGPRVLPTLPAWVTEVVPGHRGHLWAPDVIRIGDRFLLYYSVSSWGKNRSAIGLASAPTLDPARPDFAWKDEGIVVRSEATNDFNAIDPSVVRDREGRLWLAFGSFWSGIKLVELDPATGKRRADSSSVLALAQAPEIEAPGLVAHGEYYYLFVNWGLCCRGVKSTYQIRVGRSREITGPYLDRDGRDLRDGGGSPFLDADERFIGPGHAAVFGHGGESWVSFHFYDRDRAGMPTLAIRQLERGADGWPVARALVSPAGPAAVPQATPRAGGRPNIVFLLADDLGWADLGCYGADLHETPRLDRLAREGVRFTQAYAMPVCSPTRAALLTGKHAARLHYTIWREGAVERTQRAAESRWKLLPPPTIADLPHAEVTIAEQLQAAGYLTFHVGKWHLGDADHYPETQGFDVNVGGTHWGAPESYFWPFRGTNRFREFRYVPGLGAGKPGDFLTDRLTDEALKLIDAAGDRPFFLNLWFHNPHTPIQAKPEVVDRFRAKLKPGLHHRNPDYAALVAALDENVGRVLDHLERRGLRDRTLVVFMSDNGGYLGEYQGQPVNDNWPLRSGKGSLYEGGVRVPLIVRLPGVAPAGAQCHEPVACMDLARTLAEVAGVTLDTALDGLSLVPLLRDPGATLGREALYFHYPHYYATTTPVSAIRQGDWKLLEYFEDDRVELFNLKEDMGEASNLANREPTRAQAMRTRLAAWRREIGAQVPTRNQ